MDAQNKTASTTLTFSYHRLEVWPLALELNRLVRKYPLRSAELRNQASRAIQSAALNIAEAAGHEGANRTRHFKIARGSAMEVAGAYELAAVWGEQAPVQQVLQGLHRLVSMLSKLSR